MLLAVRFIPAVEVKATACARLRVPTVTLLALAFVLLKTGVFNVRILPEPEMSPANLI